MRQWRALSLQVASITSKASHHDNQRTRSARRQSQAHYRRARHAARQRQGCCRGRRTLRAGRTRRSQKAPGRGRERALPRHVHADSADGMYKTTRVLAADAAARAARAAAHVEAAERAEEQAITASEQAAGCVALVRRAESHLQEGAMESAAVLELLALLAPYFAAVKAAAQECKDAEWRAGDLMVELVAVRRMGDYVEWVENAISKTQVSRNSAKDGAETLARIADQLSQAYGSAAASAAAADKAAAGAARCAAAAAVAGVTDAAAERACKGAASAQADALKHMEAAQAACDCEARASAQTLWKHEAEVSVHCGRVARYYEEAQSDFGDVQRLAALANEKGSDVARAAGEAAAALQAVYAVMPWPPESACWDYVTLLDLVEGAEQGRVLRMNLWRVSDVMHAHIPLH